MSITQRIATSLLTVTLLGGLTGCWSNRPIDLRALVLTIGVGRGPGSELTLYFRVPTAQALTSLTSGGSGTTTASSYVLKGIGATFSSAFSAAQNLSDRDIYLGQTQMVLFSSKLSPAQFSNAIHSLLRLGPMDKTAFAAVSTQPLTKVFSFQPTQVRIPDLYFRALFSCRHCQAVNLQSTLWTVEKRTLTPDISLWLPVITAGQSGYALNQVAVYHGDRIGLFLNSSQYRSLGYVLGRTSKAAVTLKTRWGNVGIRALKTAPRISARLVDKQLELSVHCSVSGTIDSLPAGLATPANILELESMTSKTLSHNIQSVLLDLKRHGDDPVGFSERLLWIHPHLRAQWPVLYRHARLAVTVTTQINNVGDTT